METKLKDGEYPLQAKLDSLQKFKDKWKSEIEESGLSDTYLINIERYRDHLNKLQKRKFERRRQLSEFERALSTEYANMLEMGENKFLTPNDKVKALYGFLQKWEVKANEYDRGLDKIATIKRRLKYWKNHNKSTSIEKGKESEGWLNNLFSIWKTKEVPVERLTNHKNPMFDKSSSVSLRSSYRKLSVSQVQSMSNISIRIKMNWGFYCHSTIKHNYNLKFINGDKVVIDHDTNLMWHQSGSKEYISWDPRYTMLKGARKWVKDLNNRGYAGYKDWRLPTVEEAASLLESSMNNSGLYLAPLFDNEQSSILTGDKYGLEAAWIVSFRNGSVYWSSITGINVSDFVRPVRSMK